MVLATLQPAFKACDSCSTQKPMVNLKLVQSNLVVLENCIIHPIPAIAVQQTLFRDSHLASCLRKSILEIMI